MLHHHLTVGHQCNLLLEGIFVLRQLGILFICLLVVSIRLCLRISLRVALLLAHRFLWRLLVLLRVVGRGLLETLVGLLQEGDMVIERLHIERAVDIQVAVVRDGITQRGAIVELCATHPRIGGIIRGIHLEPVEDRQFVDRYLITGRERLLIVERRTPMLDTGPHRVLPSRIAVGIEVFVHRRVGFLNLSVGGTLEVHVQVLRQVPTQLELTVPQELLAERQRQVGVLCILQVALLQLIVVTRHLRVKRDGLRQIVEAQRLGELHPLRLALRVLEGLPGLKHGRIAVVHRASPLIVVLIDGSLASGVTMGVTIREREVGRVDGQGVTLVLDVHPDVAQREVARCMLGHRYRLDRVTLALVGSRLEGVVQFHIRIQRVVLRTDNLLRIRVIERCRHFGLVREELS